MCGLGTLGFSEAPSEGPWGENYFHNTIKTLFTFFTLILKRMCSGVYRVYMICNSIIAFMSNAMCACVLKWSILISTQINIDTFNPYKQKLLEPWIVKSV